jgi:hypothetical protein
MEVVSYKHDTTAYHRLMIERLFIIEGLITVCIAIVAFFVLPSE